MSGLASRIALVALVAVAVAVAILSVGVWWVGGEAFTALMVEAGDTAEHARAMFDQSVTAVLLVSVGIAALAGLVLAAVLARRIARPIASVGSAARQLSDGDYAVRVPRVGPEELASLVDSFNQMAETLEQEETRRRDFIANAAHELRTPLTNLSGYLEALRDGVLQADRSTYQSLWEEADRLVRLAHSLDELAQGDRSAHIAAPTDLDLAATLRASLDLVEPAFAARGIRVERRVPLVLPARADPDHLAQVIANLLQNALRYTPVGGRVTVSAESRGSDIRVSVANTGEGIPAGDLPRIFERFYRVDKSRDRSRGGAGIGLAIVKQLVEAAGGAVGAESSAGRTQLWFSLPAGTSRPVAEG